MPSSKLSTSHDDAARASTGYGSHSRELVSLSGVTHPGTAPTMAISRSLVLPAALFAASCAGQAAPRPSPEGPVPMASLPQYLPGQPKSPESPVQRSLFLENGFAPSTPTEGAETSAQSALACPSTCIPTALSSRAMKPQPNAFSETARRNSLEPFLSGKSIENSPSLT